MLSRVKPPSANMVTICEDQPGRFFCQMIFAKMIETKKTNAPSETISPMMNEKYNG